MTRLRIVVLSLALVTASIEYAVGANIVLVKGTTSIPNKAERTYAESVTSRISRWLDEMGVGHETIGDEDVTSVRLRSARIVILGYNPNPRKSEIRALDAFVKRGGKLIVFYSAEPKLAKLMHMKLGKYKACKDGGRWSEIRFGSHASAYVPQVIRQESRNIRPVYPAKRGARVIAYWRGDGSLPEPRDPDPAWVQSEHGLWMTHILLDDGDTWNKKLMLLGLIGTYDGSVWRTAAAKTMSRAGTLGRFETFRLAQEAIAQKVRGTGRESVVAALLTKARSAYGELGDLLMQNRYPEVVVRSRYLFEALTKAYAAASISGAADVGRSGRPSEFRGIWDHSGVGLYPGDWDRTCRVLASNGITDLLVNVLWSGAAHYDSDIVPESETFKIRGDQLTQCVKAARRHGIRVHVWKVCWYLGKASPKFVKSLRKKGRLQVSNTGETTNWLCPSNLDNVRMEKDAIREVIQKYDIDGVHLDYIRYPNSRYCYCATCRREFGREVGRKLRNWPAIVRSGKLKKRYSDWRTSRITRIVRDTYALINRAKPGLKLSVAVYGKYPTCVGSVAQDWGSWLEQGIVDFVCPMNYTTDLVRFEEYVDAQLSLRGARGKVFPGIGVTAAESRLDVLQVVDQISALRRKGAVGFVLFDLNRAVAGEVLPLLGLGR